MELRPESDQHDSGAAIVIERAGRFLPCGRAVLALLVGAIAAGCGGGGGASPGRTTGAVHYLDTSRVARAITQSIETKRHLRARVVCPQGIAQRTGFDFACLATYPGGQTTFTVTQVDDRGHVSYVGH